jgi:hypothetical protein
MAPDARYHVFAWQELSATLANGIVVDDMGKTNAVASMWLVFLTFM